MNILFISIKLIIKHYLMTDVALRAYFACLYLFTIVSVNLVISPLPLPPLTPSYLSYPYPPYYPLPPSLDNNP